MIKSIDKPKKPRKKILDKIPATFEELVKAIFCDAEGQGKPRNERGGNSA